MFLRNCWYVAALDRELIDGRLLSRMLLGQHVLLFRGDGMKVATVGGNGQVILKPVTIGRDYGSDIEIVQGLAADDKVILSPPDSLTDGVNVRVAPPPPGKVAKS